MKKVIITTLLCLIVCLTGCGEDKDERVLFQDDGVSVVDDSEDKAAQMQEIQDDIHQAELNRDANLQTLDKQTYNDYIAALPKTEAGSIDIKQFSPEQQAIYDNFINGVYNTDFSVDEVRADINEFFGAENIARIHNTKYRETINKIYGKQFDKDAEKYQTCIYNATVYDNNIHRVYEAEVSVRAGVDNFIYNYDYTLNNENGYYYGFKKIQRGKHLDTFYFVDKLKSINSPLIDLQTIFETGISDLVIESISENIYDCSFKVDAAVFNQTDLANRSFIEPIFNSDDNTKDATIIGEVWVDYNNNVISKILFTQQVTEEHKNIYSYAFEDYNTDENEAMVSSIDTYEDAKVLAQYIEDKRNAYINDPNTVIAQQSESSSSKSRVDEYVEETYEKNDIEQGANMENNMDIAPAGMRSIVDITGKRVYDINGSAMYVFEDTLIPVNPNQIPEGMTTPIGDQPIENATLQIMVN